MFSIKKLDSITLKIYLHFCYLKKKCLAKRINENGSVLILADLLLGDLAIAGFLIGNIRKKYPKKNIVLLCKDNLKEVACLFPIDHVIGVREFKWHILNELKKLSPKGYSEVFNIFSSKWLPLTSGLITDEVHGYISNKKNNKYLTKTLPFPTKETNCVDIFNALLFDEKIEKKIDLKLDFSSNENLYKFKYIVIHIGAGTSPRLWPHDLLFETINCIISKKLYVILTGFSQDIKYMTKLEYKIKNKKRIINLIDQTNVIDLIKLISKSSGLISFDTAVIHWARLLQIKSLSILGQTDANIFGANSKLFENAYEIKIPSLDCQNENSFYGINVPWMKNCHRDICIENEIKCVKNISIKFLNKNVKKFLERQGNIQ